MEIRHLAPSDVTLLAEIDRSEVIRIGYGLDDGRLVRYDDVVWDSPPWAIEGTGEHTVHHMITFTREIVQRGAQLLGAFDGDDLMGLAVVEPDFEPELAWFALLHVSRPYRRQGVGTALWDESVRICREAGAPRMYVSATPSGSAVGFYLAQGCRLAEPPHPDLLAMEPDDIHLVVDISP